MPEDSGGDNVYNVTVRARDTASPVNTRELEVVVTVTDVNERPDIDEDTVPSYVEIQYDSTGTRPDVHTFTADRLRRHGDTFVVVPARHGRGLPGHWRHDRHPDLHAGQPASATARCPTSSILATTTSVTAAATPTPSSFVATDNHMKAEEYAIIVTVTDVNEIPEFTGTPDTAITLDEHDANTNYVVMRPGGLRRPRRGGRRDLVAHGHGQARF